MGGDLPDHMVLKGGIPESGTITSDNLKEMLELARAQEVAKGGQQWVSPKEPSQTDRGRIGVVETVYYQSPRDNAMAVETRWGKTLETEDEPYARRVKIGPKWWNLDCGWLENGCSQIVIQNPEPRFQRIPTDEEHKSAYSKHVELGHVEHSGCEWVIPVGGSMRGTPINLKNLQLRSPNGETWVSITLLPL